MVDLDRLCSCADEKPPFNKQVCSYVTSVTSRRILKIMVFPFQEKIS